MAPNRRWGTACDPSGRTEPVVQLEKNFNRGRVQGLGHWVSECRPQGGSTGAIWLRVL